MLFVADGADAVADKMSAVDRSVVTLEVVEYVLPANYIHTSTV